MAVEKSIPPSPSLPPARRWQRGLGAGRESENPSPKGCQGIKNAIIKVAGPIQNEESQ